MWKGLYKCTNGEFLDIYTQYWPEGKQNHEKMPRTLKFGIELEWLEKNKVPTVRE